MRDLAFASRSDALFSLLGCTQVGPGSSAQHGAFLPMPSATPGCKGERDPLSQTDSLDSFKCELRFPPVAMDLWLCLGVFHASD